MGYRSEVIVAFKSDFYEENKTLIDKLTAYCDKAFVKNKINYFVWDYVKWYDTYPEVCALEKFISDNSDTKAALARMGEDIGDVEFLNDPGSLGIRFHREFSIDS
jgi:ribosomal protein S17E